MSVIAPTETTDESAELAEYRARCCAWLADHLVPLARVGDEGGEDPSSLSAAKAVQARLFDGGFAGISWPKEYGGQGLTMAHQRVFNEEAAAYHLPTGVFIIGLGMCAPTLLEFGTEAHRRRHIAKMLRGDEIWCQLFSEPGAGSDVASLRTRAVRDGSDWVINGQKVWTSGAHFSDYGLLIARTNPDVPKHKGITMFILDMRAPGVTVRPLKTMTGNSAFNEVFLDNVRVPAENLLGTENEGWRAAIATLMNERVSLGAGGGGAGRRSGGGEFDRVLAVARQADVLDAARTRELLADVYCRSRVLELLSNRIRADVRAGRAPGPEGSIAKLASNEVIQAAADAAFEIAGLGAQAWEQGDEASEQLAAAVLAYPGLSIAGGTTDIMKNILGERVLGLPKEPQVDRGVPFRDLRVGTSR